MLAYLADWSDEIGEAFRNGGRIIAPDHVVVDDAPASPEDVARGNANE